MNRNHPKQILAVLGTIASVGGAFSCAQVIGIEDTTLEPAKQCPADAAKPSGQDGPVPETSELQSDFSCYGKSLPPSPVDITITATAFDFSKGTSPPVPMPGVAVEICTSIVFGQCTNTLPGTTDETGNFSTPIGTKVFNGYVRFSGMCPSLSGGAS